jgi:hypothetical protein
MGLGFGGHDAFSLCEDNACSTPELSASARQPDFF